MALARISESGLPLAYVNLVGGQDELVLTGLFRAWRRQLLRVLLPSFGGKPAVTQWRRGEDRWVCEEGMRIRPDADLGHL